MSKPNILISGSGIAGSVFASWMLRANKDAQITIIERDPALRLTGASVDIRSTAVDIIKWMGAEQEIRNHTTKEEGVQFVHANSKEIDTFAATGREDVQSITSEFEIFRGALAKVFISPIQDKVKLIFDEYVDTFEQHDDGVEVTFARSKEVKKYGLLVAADGLSSRIRGRLLDSKPRDQIRSDGAHVCYFTVKSDLLKGSRLAKWYSTTGGRAIFLRPDPDPAGRSRAHFVNVTTSGNAEMRERLDKALREGNESYMKLMEESFHDAGWLAPEILQAMRESDDFYCSVFAQVRSPILQDGHVVLLGDAGYATPGIGTSLAIMGGYVLAGELMDHPNDTKVALKRYEEIMTPFVKKSQSGLSNGLQLLNPQTQWGLTIRNMILAFISWSKLVDFEMSVLVWLGWSEAKLDMPEYKWPL